MFHVPRHLTRSRKDQDVFPAFCLTRNNQRIATGGSENALTLWDVESREKSSAWRVRERCSCPRRFLPMAPSSVA
jgi:hypothetical protein